MSSVNGVIKFLPIIASISDIHSLIIYIPIYGGIRRDLPCISVSHGSVTNNNDANHYASGIDVSPCHPISGNRRWFSSAFLFVCEAVSTELRQIESGYLVLQSIAPTDSKI